MKVTADGANKYQKLDEIGRGSYAPVNRAIHKQTGEICAIKTLPSIASDSIASDSMSNLINEIKTLKTSKCKNIVRFLAWHQTLKEELIVMEYCSGGSVKDAMRSLDRTMNVEQITVILRDVLNGLDYLHSAQKIHRDVKAANILLHENGVAKLGDFGVSEPLDSKGRKENHFIGTLLWLPPEVINKDPNYGTAIDIWSLGVTIVEMGDGQPPHSGEKNPLDEIANLDKPSASFKDLAKWPQNLVEIVALCLEKNASKRKSAKDLLGHEMIVNAPSNDVLRRLVAEVRSSKSNQTESSLFKKSKFLLIENSILFGIYEQRNKNVIKVDHMVDKYGSVEREFEHLCQMSKDRRIQIDQIKGNHERAKLGVHELEKEKTFLDSKLDELRKRELELKNNLDRIKDEIQKLSNKSNKLRSLESR